MSAAVPTRKRPRDIRRAARSKIAAQAAALQTLFAARAYYASMCDAQPTQQHRHDAAMNVFNFYLNGEVAQNESKPRGGFWCDDAASDPYWSLARSKLSEHSKITKEMISTVKTKKKGLKDCVESMTGARIVHIVATSHIAAKKMISSYYLPAWIRICGNDGSKKVLGVPWDAPCGSDSMLQRVRNELYRNLCARKRQRTADNAAAQKPLDDLDESDRSLSDGDDPSVDDIVCAVSQSVGSTAPINWFPPWLLTAELCSLPCEFISDSLQPIAAFSGGMAGDIARFKSRQRQRGDCRSLPQFQMQLEWQPGESELQFSFVFAHAGLGSGRASPSAFQSISELMDRHYLLALDLEQQKRDTWALSKSLSRRQALEHKINSLEMLMRTYEKWEPEYQHALTRYRAALIELIDFDDSAPPVAEIK